MFSDERYSNQTLFRPKDSSTKLYFGQKMIYISMTHRILLVFELCWCFCLSVCEHERWVYECVRGLWDWALRLWVLCLWAWAFQRSMLAVDIVGGWLRFRGLCWRLASFWRSMLAIGRRFGGLCWRLSSLVRHAPGILLYLALILVVILIFFMYFFSI